MKEVFEKIIERLRYEKEIDRSKVYNPAQCDAIRYSFGAAIDAVKTITEKYDDDWIPYTDKSTPKVGSIVDVWLTLEDGVYKAVWSCDHFEWENGRAVTDKVLAWMDNSVPAPYQPKGE